MAQKAEIWTEPEVETLRKYMQREETLMDVARAMDRTPMAVLLKVRKIIGLDPNQYEDKGTAYMRFTPWSAEDDSQLVRMFNAGQGINAMAKYFDRTPKAIVMRIQQVLTNAKDLNKTYLKLKKLRKLGENEVVVPKQVQVVTKSIEPGYYRHFKGNYYQLIEVAKHSETLEPMVVYRALYGEKGLWVRPAGMWTEMIDRPGYKGPRFVKVEESEAKGSQKSNPKGGKESSNSGKRWSKADEKTLVAMYEANDSYATIANKIKRTESAVMSRLQVLGYLRYDSETKEIIRIK